MSDRILITHLDHIVLTVADIEATCAFYSQVLGMEIIAFSNNGKALAFGGHKINLHQTSKEFEPKAARPTPGSANLCLIIPLPLNQVIAHLDGHNIPVIDGPVRRAGACGAIELVYFRDPDGNLIEVSNYL